MIQCTKCGNETRTTHLTTPGGDVLLAGTLSVDPQPIIAYVCSACGYTELYAPQPLERPEAAASEELPLSGDVSTPAPAAASEL